MESTLDETLIKILKLIHENSFGSTEEFESRLAEKSSGDVEFLQNGVPSGFTLTEREFISLLHHLESEGYLGSSETVHKFDSSEQILKWHITYKGKLVLIASDLEN